MEFPQELYHYCPTESFYGMISSKTIWLSNSEYANDPNENKIANDVLIEILSSSNNKLKNHFVNKVLDYDDHETIETTSSYVFCMSEKKDDLNQWRIYGDYGYGYMIGLKPEYFISNGLWTLLEEDIVPNDIYDKIYLAKCIYNRNQQKAIIENLINIFMNKKIPDGNGNSNISSFKFYLRFYASLFKHHSYLDENEWRIICFPLPAINQNYKYDIFYRPNRGVIIQYLKHDYLKESSLTKHPFGIIFLGSNIYNREREIAEFMFFNKARYYQLSKSQVKIRPI